MKATFTLRNHSTKKSHNNEAIAGRVNSGMMLEGELVMMRLWPQDEKIKEEGKMKKRNLKNKKRGQNRCLITGTWICRAFQNVC